MTLESTDTSKVGSLAAFYGLARDVVYSSKQSRSTKIVPGKNKKHLVRKKEFASENGKVFRDQKTQFETDELDGSEFTVHKIGTLHELFERINKVTEQMKKNEGSLPLCERLIPFVFELPESNDGEENLSFFSKTKSFMGKLTYPVKWVISKFSSSKPAVQEADNLNSVAKENTEDNVIPKLDSTLAVQGDVLDVD